VKIVQALPNAAKVAAGGNLQLPTPTRQPVRESVATPSGNLPIGLIVGGGVLLVAAIVMGWMLGRRTRR
jgi:hypothetical protein